MTAARANANPAPILVPTVHFIGVSGGDFEAGDSALKSRGYLGELFDGGVGLLQRIDGLLRGFPELGERFADLLRAEGLRLHPFVYRLEIRRQRLHFFDD